MTKLMVVSSLILLTSCKTLDPYIVSGESLSILADTFVDTAKVMDKGFEDGVIDVATYATWASFGVKFQMAYPLAIRLWKLAVDTQDKKLLDQSTRILTDLTLELATFSNKESK